MLGKPPTTSQATSKLANKYERTLASLRAPSYTGFADVQAVIYGDQAIEGRANVKLAGRPGDGLDSAVERFLGKGVDAVTRTAQQVIEGALRGVVAAVSPEEANAKRLEHLLEQLGSPSI